MSQSVPMLSVSDHTFFRENGYVVVSDVVPPQNLEAVIAALWDYLGINPNDPNDWYRAPLAPNGMLELYQHPALWENRQHLRVYQAFREIFGTEKLWATVDRANLKPPRHPNHPEYDDKGFIHWDTDTSRLPLPLGVQGVLYLTDTSAAQGGFQCVPELYRDLEAWIQTQPPDRNPRRPDLTGYAVRPIPGRAGDLVIWNRLLPHGNGHNLSSRPRMAQYLSMFPAPIVAEDASDEARAKVEGWRQDRISRWQNRLAPQGDWVVGDPRGWEQEHGQTAKLSSLGRKLLGLDLWPD